MAQMDSVWFTQKEFLPKKHPLYTYAPIQYTLLDRYIDVSVCKASAHPPREWLEGPVLTPPFYSPSVKASFTICTQTISRKRSRQWIHFSLFSQLNEPQSLYLPQPEVLSESFKPSVLLDSYMQLQIGF